MKHLGISGGGTKIAGLFGAAESIIDDKNYKPDIISGISAGAILAVPLALGKRKEIKDIVLNLKLKTFFSKSPIKKNGKIKVGNAIWSIISGKHYLGKQGNLEKNLARVVSVSDFEEFKKNPKIPVCIVGSVDFYTGKRLYVNLKEVSYGLFLKFVNASSSIPVYTPGIRMDMVIKDFEGKSSGYPKSMLFDGGVRDHSPSQKILESNNENFKVTETCTIFSRPEKLTEILNPKEFEVKDILEVLGRHINISNAEISKNDFAEEQHIIKERKIYDHGTIYLPKVMEGFYDIDKQRLRKLYRQSKTSVDTYWKE